MTTTDPENTWQDTRLPPVYLEIPDPAGAGWLGRRKAFFVNGGLTVKQIGPLLVPKLGASPRTLVLGGVFVLLAGLAFIADYVHFPGAGTLGAALLVCSAAIAVAHVKTALTYRDIGDLWDQARDLTFSAYGDKLFTLGNIRTDHERSEVTTMILMLAGTRAALLRDHAGYGPVQGEPELLHALEALGDFIRHLQDGPENRRNLPYTDVADARTKAYGAAIEAMTAFRELDMSGMALVGPDELTRIAEGTRK